MHNNYYFLRQLSHTLQQKIIDYTVVSCFSQNKEELIIELNNGQNSFFIKAHLLSSFCCLAFPAQFNRAKKNSIDLFPEIILKKIIAIQQFENERSFAIHLTNGYMLIFKMHANRSNVLLALDGSVKLIFRNQFTSDKALTIDQLNQQINWSEDFFQQNKARLKQAYFTFGKEVWSYLENKGFSELPSNQQWDLFRQIKHEMEKPKFYIYSQNNRVKLTLLKPSEGTATELADPIQAINEFFLLYQTTNTLHKEKDALMKKLSQSLESNERYIEKNQEKLDRLSLDSPYKKWADLLMAHLNTIETGSKEVKLQDFENQPITIKLKPALSTIKNAEIFYRKAKNQNIEIKKLSESIVAKKTEIEHVKNQLKILDDVDSLAVLKQNFKFTNPQKEKETAELPFHSIVFMNYHIWIGKNAVNNDLLTLKYAHKDDLWLHAKDVSGSHVVVKHQSGRTFPKEVIERAAQLAAYNSKRKTESLCPVAYTQKKYVRKRKRDPPGAVVVDREDVIMVVPTL